MNSVRLPDDDDKEKLEYLLANGGGKEIGDVIEDLLGYHPEEILVLAFKIAINQSLESESSIDINDLINQYNEWQDSLS